MSLTAGTCLAHYKIREPIGKGGMGEVYLAEDTKLDRKVALKVLPPELAEDEGRRARFQREAKALAALNHPNIITIHSVEEADDIHFITMEWVKGKTLADLIPKNGMSLEKFFEVAVPLANAVAAAHEAGIVHRDLKPGNVMVTEDGRVKVLDFGLAKSTGGIAGTDVDSNLPTAAKTEQGVIVGTCRYMSPEQIEGKPVDARSDVFSLGILLCEMATGTRPFDGDSAVGVMSSTLKDTPPTITELRAESPEALSQLVARCLEKRAADRFASGATVKEALAGVLGTQVRRFARPGIALTERRPFIGRQTERAQLDGMLDRIAEGRGGLVLLGGEPGVGKTRLAQEMLADARERGHATLVGHCYE